jgi:hypothetical protein
VGSRTWRQADQAAQAEAQLASWRILMDVAWGFFLISSVLLIAILFALRASMKRQAEEIRRARIKQELEELDGSLNPPDVRSSVRPPPIVFPGPSSTVSGRVAERNRRTVFRDNQNAGGGYGGIMLSPQNGDTIVLRGGERDGGFFIGPPPTDMPVSVEDLKEIQMLSSFEEFEAPTADSGSDDSGRR